MTDVLFVHVPKTGGTSIRDAMGPGLKVIAEDMRKEDAHKILDGGGLITVGHASYQDLVMRDLWSHPFFNRAYTFMVVRNPYARFLSLYRYIRHISSRSGAESADARWLEPQTFEEFCTLRRERYHDQATYAWTARERLAPQLAWYWFPRMDKVLRFETLDEEWPDVARLIGARETLPHRNKISDHAQVEVVRDYKSFYTEETRDAVEEVYGSDLGMWDYEFEEVRV